MWKCRWKHQMWSIDVHVLQMETTVDAEWWSVTLSLSNSSLREVMWYLHMCRGQKVCRDVGETRGKIITTITRHLFTGGFLATKRGGSLDQVTLEWRRKGWLMFLSFNERVPESRSRETGGRHSQVDGGRRSEGARGRHDRGHAGMERMALNVKRSSIWNFTWSQWRGCKTGAMWSSQETVTGSDERGRSTGGGGPPVVHSGFCQGRSPWWCPQQAEMLWRTFLPFIPENGRSAVG